MKILHLRSSNFYGGPERQLCEHAHRMIGSGYIVAVGSFSENGRDPEFLKVAGDAGVPTAVIAVTHAYDWSAVVKIRQYLKAETVDIFCTHDYRSHLLGHLVRRKSTARHICFVRGYTQDNLKVRLYQLADRLFLRCADHIVTVSCAQVDRLSGWGIPCSKLSVVHNAVAIEALSRLAAVDLRADHGWTPDNLVVVTAGRFSAEKGQRFLIDAAACCLNQNDQLRFILFGDGPDLTVVQRLIARMGLSSKILCPGFRRDLISALKGADILVNPSKSEGLPNIVLESMAVGVPVIATAVGGVPELVEDNRTGRLVKYGDVDRLSQAILELAGDSTTRKRLAKAATEEVQQRFSFDRQAQLLEHIYKMVAA